MKNTRTVVLLTLLLTGCGQGPLNSPHQADTSQNIRFASFAESPKTLDPARSYNSNEAIFTAQVYEPPLQYHYLKRPYTLVPLTAAQMPDVIYLNKQGQVLPPNTTPDKIAYTLYDISIQPGIYFQPDPAFGATPRELTAADYVYQIKRLANPKLNSPILGVMEKYIAGLKAYAERLKHESEKQGEGVFLDLRKYDFEGARVLDKYRYQIKVKGLYPQFKYWLAMPFFAPMAWEVDEFYSSDDKLDENKNLDWHPVGTGPYMLTENNPNKQMVLERNPNFHLERYPVKGEAGDAEKGYLDDADKRLPFIDKVIFTLEKETIPRWNKFLQGYYDLSAISSDSFDQAIQIDKNGEPDLTPEMKQKKIYLQTSISPNVFYLGFNMMDPVVGGNSERARKLRRAISLAVDYDEYISIFMNGRGVLAQSPIPPEIFGYTQGENGINPYIYEWKNNRPVQKDLTEAKKILKEAGYPDGINPKTGKPLVLNYDVPATAGPDDAARLAWMRKQFAKLGIQLHIRSTQYNRFQEKMHNGNAQIFMWGWMADYPDPENFLFLLYGPNSMAKKHGENASNYENKEYDRLFDKMRVLPNGPERQAVIDKMLNIVRHDAPWVFGVHAKSFILSHAWNKRSKPNSMANNTLKYQRIDTSMRKALQAKWNAPITWPLFAVGGGLILLFIPGFVIHRRRQRQKGK